VSSPQKLQKKVREDPIAWLLEPDNLSVRYLTLRHLLGCAKDDPEVQAARTAIPRSQIVKRIVRWIGTMRQGGGWNDP